MTSFPLLEKTLSLDSFPVRVSTQCLRERNHLHIHRHLQICYVLSGTLRHVIDGKEYIQLPDSCAFILPYMQHRTDLVDSEDTPVVVFMTFGESFLTDNGYDLFCHSKYFEGYSIPVIREFKTDEARDLIHNTIDIFSPDGDSDYASIAKNIARLFSLACTEELPKKPSRILRNRVSDINRAVACISERYSEKLAIDDLATFSNMSRSTFTTNFKSVTGLSFLDFLMSARLDAALHFHNNETPDEIARATGLHDRTNLTRVFKKYLGMTCK